MWTAKKPTRTKMHEARNITPNRQAINRNPPGCAGPEDFEIDFDLKHDILLSAEVTSIANLDAGAEKMTKPWGKIILGAAVLLISGRGFVTAATITFASPTPVTHGSATAGQTDIVTTGSLVAAYSLGGIPLGGTDNGVTFAKSNTTSPFGGANISIPAGGNSTGLGSYGGFTTTGDSNYDNILSDAVYAPESGAETLTFTVTSGHQYEFQLWAIGGGMTVGILLTSAANSVTVPNGDFVTGTFTADAGTQTLSWGNRGNSYDIMNAIQLRDLSAPEPATTSLVCLSIAVGLFARRRRT
jgi:hypothetical protein